MSLNTRMLKLVLMLPMVALGLASALAADEPAAVKKVLSDLIPDAKPDSLKPAPMPGFFEVTYGAQVFYVSQDGRYVLQGDVLDTKERRNLTEDTRSGKRLEAINAVGEDKMIVFAPKQVKHTISVFTDIDCGFCRKLHQEIAQYNELGIKVRYLAFPRGGPESPSFDKAVSVWCSADRNAAITRAKAGEELAKKSCDNPVRAEYELGKRMGINGTPAIILEDGSMLPGYVPPHRLALLLDQGVQHP